MNDTKSLDLPVDEDYVPGAGELNNFVYLICKYAVGWQMRAVDLQVCLMMAGEVKGNSGLSRLCDVTCEYVWDHICGEPSDFSPDDLFNHMKVGLREFYEKTSVEDWNNTGSDD